MRCHHQAVEQRCACSLSVHCVNVVIGVVHCELLVVRVVPVVVCDDAVVRRTLVLIAFTVAFVFVVAILHKILLYWRCSVYRIRHPQSCTASHQKNFVRWHTVNIVQIKIVVLGWKLRLVLGVLV